MSSGVPSPGDQSTSNQDLSVGDASEEDSECSEPVSLHTMEVMRPVKLSPGTPQSSPRETGSAPMILMPRDSEPRAIGVLGGQPVYVMPVEQGAARGFRGALGSLGGGGNPGTTGGIYSNLSSPYNSPPHNQQGLLQLSPPPPLAGICHIQILEDPEEKFRFRYKSEMQGTHGCIHGRNYTKKAKKFPTIQVNNVPSDVSHVRVRVALYTNEKPRNHHVHKVMWKAASETEQNFVESEVSRGQGFRHTWQGLGIIHTSRKYIDETLFSRIRKVFLEQKGATQNNNNPDLTDAEELKLKADAHTMGKMVTDKLNTVVLGFEAFRVDNGIYRPLCSMAFSNAINNLKNPSTGELKICRISSFAGSVEGGEEVFIFIERVKKGDINVKFFELDRDEERVWEECAEFQEGDVHHQYAIAFKTPQYHDLTVDEDVRVFFELYRPSDGAVSEPKAFRYKPSETVRLGKRARLSDFSLRGNRAQQNGMEESDNNLTNIIENLLKDEEYMDHLSEPSPYDHLGTPCHTLPPLATRPACHTSNIVPDLLVFGRPSGTIMSDSAVVGEERLENMTRALLNLTSSTDKERARQQLEDSLLELTNNEGNNLLHSTVLGGQLEPLSRILDTISQADLMSVLDSPNREGSPALHLGVVEGEVDMVRLLLDSGANINSRDRDGETPLHLALRKEDEQILRVLLEFQADPNIPNHFGKFPLHIAVENNLLSLLRVLVDKGLDLDARDQVAGKTAIHLAVERNLEEMVLYLVKEAKVDMTLEDYSGITLLHLAENHNSVTISKTVKKAIKKQTAQ